MTTYNTGNPIGSTDPRDLYDNAKNLDEAVNTRTAESWGDRFGVARKTWWGMEQDFQQFLIDSGYEDIGDYGPGLEITGRNQIFWRDGELYRAGASLELPYTTTGDWGSEGGLFVAVGDAALRQELANPGLGAAMVAYRLALTGAQPWDVQGKLQGRVSFLDFIPEPERAAIISGQSTLDCTTYIQEAINRTPEGWVLYGGNGSFTISGVTVPKSLTLDLTGTKIKVKESAGAAFDIPTGVGFVEVRGGTVEYLGSRYFGANSPDKPDWYNAIQKGPEKDGFRSRSATFKCLGVTVVGFSGVGIRAEEGKYVHLDSCIATDNGYAGAFSQGESTAITQGIYNYNGGGNGIDGYGVVVNVYMGNYDEGKCVVSGVTAIGNYTRGIDTHSGNNIRLIGNHAQDTGRAHPNWGNLGNEIGYGLRATRRCHKLIIIGNVVKNNTGAQIIADCQSSWFAVDEIIVSSNIAQGFRPCYFRPNETRRVVVSGNILTPESDGQDALLVAPYPGDGAYSGIGYFTLSDNTMPSGSVRLIYGPVPPSEPCRLQIMGNSMGRFEFTKTAGYSLIASICENQVGDEILLNVPVDSFDTRVDVNGNDVSGAVRVGASWGRVVNNTIRGVVTGGNLESVSGNTIINPSPYAIYRTSSLPVAIEGNTIIGAAIAPVLRTTDAPGTSIKGNRFLNSDGTPDNRNQYQLDTSFMFKASGSLISDRVHLDPAAGEYYIASPAFDPANFVGAFRVGDIARRQSPSALNGFGWVLTATGWKKFGTIEA